MRLIDNRRDVVCAGAAMRGQRNPAPATVAAGDRTGARRRMEPDEIATLVRRAQDGHGTALEPLLAYLAPHLLRAVRVLLGPKHPDLEDVVQEVLIAVMDALPSFRGESTLLHFAIRIAARRTTTVRRRAHSVRGWVEQLWRREEPLLIGPPSPGDETVAERRRRLLHALISELPDAQADALVMRAGLGYSIEEVADLTRAPVNTVRSRLRLAKEALRRRIAADCGLAELWEGRA